MALLAHHAEGFLQVEIMGQPFPDGPTEHAIALGLVLVVVSLMAYGAYAAVRDLLRWRQRRRI